MATQTTNNSKPDQPELRQVRTKHVEWKQLELFDEHDAQPRFYVDEDLRGWK